MEKITLKLKNNLKHLDIKKMTIFDWEVEKEEKIDEVFSNVTFSRDDSVSYYSELVTLEQEYKKYQNFKVVPNSVLIILAVVAFIFLTLFIIFGIVDIAGMGLTLAMLVFLLPGLLTAGILCVLGTIVTKKSISYANEDANRDRIYLEKVKELKDERRK